MECWLARLNASSAIMSHALEQVKAARIGVICQSSSSKLSASCLHGYSISVRKIQGFSTLFLEDSIRNSPHCPGRDNSHFALTNKGWKMSLAFFGYGILPGSFRFRGMVDFQFRGCISARTLTSWNWYIFPLHEWKLTHLNSTQPNMQEAPERFKKIKSLCVVCGLFAMLRNRKWRFWRSSSLSPQIQTIRPCNSFYALPADRRNKTLDCWLATQNVSWAVMSHALEQVNACPNRSHLPEFFIKALRFLLAWLLYFLYGNSKVFLPFSGRQYSQQPALSWP